MSNFEVKIPSCRSWDLDAVLDDLRNNRLASLDLAGVGCGDQGMLAIASVLVENTTLTSLDLEANSISNKGATTLARCLKSNRTITAINLRENCIEDDGLGQLAAAVKNSSVISNISLSGNYLSEKAATTMVESLRTNEALPQLEISASDLENQGSDKLLKALRRATLMRIASFEKVCSPDKSWFKENSKLTLGKVLSNLWGPDRRTTATVPDTSFPVYHKCKLVLLGHPESGKKALLQRLKDRSYLRNGSNADELVSVSEWNAEISKGQRCKFTTMIVKGTRTLQAWQRLYLSPDAIYLMISNVTAIETLLASSFGGLSHWAKQLRQRVGSNAVIVIVLTHIDEEQAWSNDVLADIQSRLSTEVPEADYIKCVSNLTGSGTDDIRKIIFSEATKHSAATTLATKQDILLNHQLTAAIQRIPETPTLLKWNRVHRLGVCVGNAIDEAHVLAVVKKKEKWGEMMLLGPLPLSSPTASTEVTGATDNPANEADRAGTMEFQAEMKAKSFVSEVMEQIEQNIRENKVHLSADDCHVLVDPQWLLKAYEKLQHHSVDGIFLTKGRLSEIWQVSRQVCEEILMVLEDSGCVITLIDPHKTDTDYHLLIPWLLHEYPMEDERERTTSYDVVWRLSHVPVEMFGRIIGQIHANLQSGIQLYRNHIKFEKRKCSVELQLIEAEGKLVLTVVGTWGRAVRGLCKSCIERVISPIVTTINYS